MSFHRGSAWDTETARRMWDEGATIPAIASAVGKSVSAIWNYANKAAWPKRRHLREKAHRVRCHVCIGLYTVKGDDAVYSSVCPHCGFRRAVA